MSSTNRLDSNQRIARNSIFMSVRMLFLLILSLYTTRKVLELLGIADFGVYNVVCGFVSMFSVLNTAMSNGIQRFYNFELGRNGEKGATKVYNTALYIQVIIGLVIVILAETIGLWFLYNKLVIPEDTFLSAIYIYQFAVFGFLFVIFQSPYTAAVMAHERMDFFAYVSILDAVLKLLIVYLIAYCDHDRLIFYGLALFLINILNFVIYFTYCKSKFKEIKFINKFNRNLFTSMLQFSSWNLFGTFSSVLRVQGINVIMNLFFGPVVNAAKGIAEQVNSGVQSFVGNISVPVRPQVVQSYARGDIERCLKLTYSISKLTCCFLIMLGIPIALEIDIVLKIWLGENIPSYTSSFTIIILITSIQGNLNSALSTVVHATGYMKKYQLYGTLVKILSVPVSFILLKYGAIPETALLTVMLFDILGHIACLYVAKSLVSISLRDYFFKIIVPILKVVICSLCFIFPIHYIMDFGFLRLFVVLSEGVVVVLFFTYYLALDNAERNLFKQLSIKFVSKLRKNKYE